jgi:competence protein ComEA
LNQKSIFSLGVLLVLAMFAFYLKEHPELGKRIYSPELIQVKISGPVKRPGVYSLEAGSTGKDLVEKAGGILPNASISFEVSSLDQLLVDGQALDLGKR